MRITTKFIGSSALIITLAALLSGSSYAINRRIRQTLDASYIQAQTNVQTVVRLEVALKDQITALNRLAVLTDHTEETKRYERSRQTFLEALTQLEQALPSTDRLAHIRIDNVRQQSQYLERIATQLAESSHTATNNDHPADTHAEPINSQLENSPPENKPLENNSPENDQIEQVTRALRIFEQNISAQTESLLESAYEDTTRYRQQQNSAQQRLSIFEAVSFSSVILLLILQFYGLVKPVLQSLTRLQTGVVALGDNVQGAPKIDLGTQDELQQVADTFNQMSDYLKESYQALETKVHHRTASLHQANQSLQQEVYEHIETEKELSQALDQLQKTQLQLLQIEKMSGLSQLVSGVAHEINNPASFIRGNLAPAESYVASLLAIIRGYQAECPETSDELQAAIHAADIDFITEDFPCLIKSIETGVARITAIVRSLQVFSHNDESETKSVDLHQGIESALLLLSAKLNETEHRPRITVHKDYGESPKLYCYPAQLNQVFMGLLNNAIEAINQKEFGPAPANQTPANQTPTSQTPTNQPTKSPQGSSNSPQITITITTQSDHIQISIADNGIGMDTATQARIFDPFFTTKAVGDGCGMSLAMSYQIITVNHQGSLTCQSQMGKGTRFTINIPCFLKTAVETATTKASSQALSLAAATVAYRRD